MSVIDENADAFFQALNSNSPNIDENAADFLSSLNSNSSNTVTSRSLVTTINNTGSVGSGGNVKSIVVSEKLLIKKESSYSGRNGNGGAEYTSTNKKSSTLPKSKVTKQNMNAPKTSAELKIEKLEDSISMEQRIVNLLVPGTNVLEITALVKKMKSAGKSENDEFSNQQDSDMRTAPRYICPYCGNIEQNNFITDYARGDTICKGKDGLGCGTVVQDHIVHEGSAYRKFEGEEDKSHHGPAPNKLFSSGHNLRTLISNDGENASNLRRAAEFVEMNLSQMGKDERRTRIGYKDQMKQKACRLIDHAASNLDLHEIVVTRAKEMFAEFRDLREHVHQFEAVVAGCILASYTEIGKEVYNAQSKIRIKANSATKNGRDHFANYGYSTSIGQNLLQTNAPIDEAALHPFQCQKCKRTFNAKRALQFHKCVMNEDVKDDKDIKSKKRKSSEDIPEDVFEMNPIIETRDSKIWYKCPVCTRSYGKTDTLNEHMQRHAKQRKKREQVEGMTTIDTTRLPKTNAIISTNPSVQINQHDQVMFRGLGRRPWLAQIQKDENYTTTNTTKSTTDDE